MKENSWPDCLESNSSLKVSPDQLKVCSLIETAEGRIEYLKENVLKESNANYVFEGYYSSVLELLHALVLRAGYKVENHICLGYYLRDVLGRENLFRLFDDCRFKRRSLVYYGKRMDFLVAKQTIEKSIELVKELKQLLKK